MQIPLEVTFRNVEKTEAIENLIRQKTDNLEKFCDHITGCRVAIERPHQHQRTGNPYRVRLDITVPPGHELVVKRESGEGEMHEDLPRVVRNAFDAARRQLQKLVERQRREVKTHPEQKVQALVTKLFREEGYGFIKTLDDREIYFHRNSVLNEDFDRLEIGTGVRFIEEQGEKGPQASTVQIVNKPGSRVPESGESAVEPPLDWQR